MKKDHYTLVWHGHYPDGTVMSHVTTCDGTQEDLDYHISQKLDAHYYGYDGVSDIRTIKRTDGAKLILHQLIIERAR